MTCPSPLFGALSMNAGEHRLLYAPAGTAWRLTAGNVRLTEPPRWLGERLVRVDVELREGHIHLIECGGWVMMRASTVSVLVGAAPGAPRWRWAVREFARWCALRSVRTPLRFR